MKNEVIAIAAIGNKSRALGKGNDLIWKIPADLKHFKNETKGHPIIMGSKTYESLPKRPLPFRTNIILTRKTPKLDLGVKIAHSPEEALEIAKNSLGGEKIYIIGGGQIYKLMLSLTDTLDLTLIEEEKAETQADVYFPEYENEFTKVVSKESSEHEDIKYAFTVLKRN